MLTHWENNIDSITTTTSIDVSVVHRIATTSTSIDSTNDCHRLIHWWSKIKVKVSVSKVESRRKQEQVHGSIVTDGGDWASVKTTATKCKDVGQDCNPCNWQVSLQSKELLKRKGEKCCQNS